MKRATAMIACALAGALGCGEKSVPAAGAAASSGAEEAREAPRDTFLVSGIRGTLSQEEIRGALEPRMMKFARCIEARAGEVEWLAGAVTLEFQVRLDGSVARAYPRDSSLGDRASERCVVGVAEAIRFPPPRGGEADFSWSFEMPMDDSIREPVTLPDELLASALSAQLPALVESCGEGSYAVTAYVDPEGRVLSAGAAARDEASADRDKLDCVAARVGSFAFASPGSYTAKIRFNVP